MTPRPPACRRDADAGYTMVELLVAMSIFTVLLTVFLSGLLVVYKDTAKTQAVGASADALRSSFLRLDRQVRYADAVNFPGTVNGTDYVEFRIPGQGGAVGTCYQWRRTATGTLDWRSWPTSGTAPTSWLTVATDVQPAPAATNGVAVPVFAVTPAGKDGRVHSQLAVNVMSTRSASNGADRLSATFVATNTGVDSAGNADANADLISDNPVCTPSSTRS
ncbi:type II secretion system protein J [Kineococcus gynurae]|uniref:Type II secretion system protein J n=1 Tax=Kineococcus gynurae TaxID=452979 RepID=A0ABV5LUP7_9ACTN